MKNIILLLMLLIILICVLLYLYTKSSQFFNNNIKFGVMWANTINIGDDIQTLAAINLLKKNNINDYVYVNREELSDYDKEPIVLIMNGWYMHNINKFPPSDKITPIFISVYIEKEELVSNNVEYFKKHEPIGCRDLSTKELFEKYNIKAYFSGCLTLCFDEYNIKDNKIYLVDVNGSNSGFLDDSVINLKTKYDNIEYITQDVFNNSPYINDINYRLNKAQELLDKIKRAKLILTSRLHVALPARAFNTDVKFIHKNYYTDRRFKGLTDILNGGTENIDNISPKINRNIINKFKKNISEKFTNLISKYIN